MRSKFKKQVKNLNLHANMEDFAELVTIVPLNIE